MTNAMPLDVDAGCPSGLEPAARPEESRVIDPAPFVERSRGESELNLAVFGAKCAGCIRKIEGAMLAIDGMESARLNLSTGRLTLKWRDGAVAPVSTVRALTDLGYRAAPFDPGAAKREHDREGRRLLRALAIAGFAAANIMLLSVSVWSGEGELGENARGLMHWVSALIAGPAAIYAGQPFFQSAWAALKKGRANMDVPISLAVVLALGISFYEASTGGEHAYFDAAVMLLFFLLIGRYLDHRLRWRARAAARDLLALQTTTATRITTDGIAEAVSARDIQPNDLVLLAPGDRAPVDGVVEEGSSDVDLSLVTGESAPQRLSAGDRIHAGVLNQSARLVMRASATSANSLLQELTRLIEAGEQTKSRYVRLADKAAALYVPVVHTLAATTFLVWFFIVGGGFHTAIMNAVAVLIITCPCALGLAAPAVQVVATGRLFRAGVLVKSGDALERFAEADRLIFDKTGTLTLARPVLLNADELPTDAILAAASLARISRHPLARAIVAAAERGPVAKDAVEFPGLGVQGTVNGRRAKLGRAEWIGMKPGPAGEGVMETWLQVEGDAPIRFAFEDAVREDAAETVAAIEARGLPVELLSGDKPAIAEEMARRLGVSDWRGGLTPQEKVERIEELRAAGRRPAMVGDGLNDAPSLAGAHVSLSPGSAADATQAAADFVYQGDTLAPIVEAIDVSRQSKRRVLENFAFAALYNACAVPLAAFGYVTPLIAAIAMSGSSLIVTLNALRLARRGKVQ